MCYSAWLHQQKLQITRLRQHYSFVEIQGLEELFMTEVLVLKMSLFYCTFCLLFSCLEKQCVQFKHWLNQYPFAMRTLDIIICQPTVCICLTHFEQSHQDQVICNSPSVTYLMIMMVQVLFTLIHISPSAIQINNENNRRGKDNTNLSTQDLLL